MRPTRRLAVLLLTAAALVACAPGASPSPTEPGPDPTVPADAPALLRVTTAQAIPPEHRFGWMPHIVITLDRKVLTGGAVPAIFPGPLLTPVVERPLSPNGWNKVVAAARASGLLNGPSDFTGGQIAPGGQVTRLEIIADGHAFDLSGDSGRLMECIQAPCVPQPGTPEAFAGFVSSLTDLATLVGAAELGPERPYTPAAYAIIVGAVEDAQGLPQQPQAWPLEGGFAALGEPFADGSDRRCGIVDGDDAATLRAAFAAANALTPWHDATRQPHGLQVRPLLPGDGDPCAGIV